MASNMSNLPPSHCNSVVVGALLRSSLSEYLVESVLGQGAFGTVAKCRRIADRKTVAIKMMKNQDQRAKAEVAVLLKLQFLDSDKCNLVRWYQSFISNEHICLEFEHLDKSLYDFMEDRQGQPLHMKEIRPIVQQLANALHHLKGARIIHADLKLENIMLVNHAQEPYRVKVIDFGLASDVSDAIPGSYIQSRPYRSPEIILGLPFTEAIDMWSLGIIFATLYLGFLPYPGMSEYDMMRYIVETQGQPPDTMLTRGWKTGLYFQRDHNSTNSSWKLKTPEQFFRESGIQSQETRVMKLSSLHDLVLIRAIDSETIADKAAESSDALDFVDLLNGMLQLDAAKRLTPCQVLKHRFTSMRYMVWMYHLRSYVRSCSELINPTTDSRKAVCGFVQQPSSATAHPIQQNLPSASADVSFHRGNDDTSSSYSLKRKMAYRDDDDYCHPRKRVKTDPAPPTCKALTDEPDRNLPSASADVSFHRGNDDTSSSYSLKRKMAYRDDDDYCHPRKRVKTDPAPPTCKALTDEPDRNLPSASVDVSFHRGNDDTSSSYSLKRKMAYRDDDDYCHPRKRVKTDPAPPTCKALTDEPDRNLPSASVDVSFHRGNDDTSSSYSLKRKMAYRDDDDYCHPRKRVKTDPAPPTCKALTDEPDRRSVPNENSRTQTESRALSGRKRKSLTDD